MKHLIFTIVSGIMAYLLLAFIAAEIDPFKWKEARRFVLVFLFIMTQGIYYVIIISNKASSPTPKE